MNIPREQIAALRLILDRQYEGGGPMPVTCIECAGQRVHDETVHFDGCAVSEVEKLYFELATETR